MLTSRYKIALSIALLAPSVFASPRPVQPVGPETASGPSSTTSYTYSSSSASSAVSTGSSASSFGSSGTSSAASVTSYSASSGSSASATSLSASSVSSAVSSLPSASGVGGGYQSTYATVPAGCPPATTGAPTTCYRYDKDFPTQDKWLSWECLAPLNRAAMVEGNDGNSDGPDEADNVVNAVYNTSITAGIDPRKSPDGIPRIDLEGCFAD